MKTINSPISLQPLNLDMVIADTSLLLGVSMHTALNFSHNDRRFSAFWSFDNTARYLRGMSTRKYPFLGLNELSNITSTFPTVTYLYRAIPRRDHAVTYTPYFTIDVNLQS